MDQGSLFSLVHPSIEGFTYDGTFYMGGSGDWDFDPKKISDESASSSSKWRFFMDGAMDFNWGLDNKKHGDENDTIRFDIRYYPAKSVILDANGGTVDGQSQAYYEYAYKPSYYWYGKSFSLSDHVPVRDGYTFDGWYADAACTQLISLASESASNVNSYFSSYTSDAQKQGFDNLHIYAGWAAADAVDLSGASVSGIETKTYSGSGLTQSPTVTLDGTVLAEGRDYKVLYRNNVDKGTAKYYIQGIGAYRGMVSGTFTINALPVTLIITLDQDTFTYDGETDFEPGYTVTNTEGLDLEENTDYRVSVSSRSTAGQGSVTAWTWNNNLTGRATEYFTVLPKAIEVDSVVLSPSEYTYDGTEKEPAAIVMYNGNELMRGYDYDISYTGNIQAGRAAAQINLKGNYTGSAGAEFQILPVSGTLAVTVDEDSYDHTYRESGYNKTKRPAVTVKDGDKVLELETDYELIYQHNSEAGDALAIASGIGSYVGSLGKVVFHIDPLDISTSQIMDISDQELAGSPVTPDIYLKLPGEYSWVRTNDLTGKYVLVWKENDKPGTATVTVTGIGNYTGSVSKTFTVTGEAVNPGNSENDTAGGGAGSAGGTGSGTGTTGGTTGSTGSAAGNGGGSAAGTAGGTSSSAGTTGSSGGTSGNSGSSAGSSGQAANQGKTISIAKASVGDIKAKKYTGKTLKPAVIVKLSGKTLKAGTDYTVTYKNNKNVGKATVTISGKGNYSGKVTKTFVINPKGTSLSKVSPGKKKITVKWKKQVSKMSSSLVTGYQIQYSTSSSFKKGNKTVKVKGAKKVSASIGKLKGGTKYYVRIRTYMKVKGATYYSAWSKKKAVTVKK